MGECTYGLKLPGEETELFRLGIRRTETSRFTS